MPKWLMIDEEERDRLLNAVDRIIPFKPFSDSGPVCCLPIGSVYCDMRGWMNEGFDEHAYDDFQAKMIHVFQSLIKEDEHMYAIDLFHESYMFNPHDEFPLDSFGEWLIPLLPNGDYSFFLTKDCANIIFGNGVDEFMVFIGEDLIKATRLANPVMVSSCVR